LSRLDDLSNRATGALQSFCVIRGNTDDISKIDQKSGMPEAHVQRIKDHLFNKEHDLVSGKGEFDLDDDIAQAWNQSE